MKRLIGLVVALVMMVCGGVLLTLAAKQTVTILVDEAPVRIESRAATVGSVLREAGVSLAPGDRVMPAASTRFFNAPLIRVERARPAVVIDGKTRTALSTGERRAANLLLEAQVRLFPGDRIYWNGLEVLPDTRLVGAALGAVKVRRAAAVSLTAGSETVERYSAAASLGQALWDARIELDPLDRFEPALETRIEGALAARQYRARIVDVEAQGKVRQIYTAAENVGQALRENGIVLQGLDYSLPSEAEPLPADGKIRVVRVLESVVSEQTLLPFETKYTQDPETELDHERVIDPGAPGIVVQSERVRSEDGVEVARTASREWQAQEAKTRQVGYGTKVVVRTMEVDGKTIEYWRAVNMYATSYSPCRSGPDRCHYGTASGLPAQKGVAAVTVRWFLDMRGQSVFVPGYGSAVIGDTGGGIPGRYWIDLGYNDDNYVSWHQWVTVYFLTPVPPLIPYILYP
ncbi:MAG TPA: ubiquitin-like domain-containing protein [Anaerolineaceae bacterium]|nr:ubiquitin-like domain-containing protein [Anaerolineaceae bacterium]